MAGVLRDDGHDTTRFAVRRHSWRADRDASPSEGRRRVARSGSGVLEMARFVAPIRDTDNDRVGPPQEGLPKPLR
jgi:hypothetical protein